MKNIIKEIVFDETILNVIYDNNGFENKIKFLYDKSFFKNSVISDLKEQNFYNKNFFPCEIKGNHIKLIIFENINRDTIELLHKKNINNITYFYANKEQFLKSLKEYNEIEKKIKIIDSNNIGDIFEIHTKENIYEIGDEARNDSYQDISNNLFVDSPMIIKGVSAIIHQGIEKNASDIHIEALEKYVRIRYRIDGILIESNRISINLLPGIISRLKIMASLNITERRLPQDGSFQLIKDKEKMDFRISIVPTINGEKAVIRILDNRIINVNLEDLNLNENNYNLLKNEIKKTKGIILICGPTGSGKTSSLYAILKTINDGKLNISTVEDPVEYKLDGINQVQCQSEIGRDFATILRAYLRQDPDVLMIGEIRDYETAEIAIKSALTGHLVLSTIHTNDSIGAIYRLLNIGILPYMLSASINLIISQRLVRRLCVHCKIQDEDFMGKLVLLNGNDVINSTEKHIFYKGNGCEKCNFTGYMGRLGIFEILPITDSIKDAIDKKMSLKELEITAKNNGLKYLYEDGIEKAREGLTSLDEIIKHS
ncbi:MAG: GspE/PulE family protein [Fusobacteriaceae bacterium]|jgi:type II secretory ATPase GspE/PulE/Tfp pilus assembly ATPase PilB-like protein|nr:GspE/PulE family protein [Fusobacteriaceae bacterium]